jgi:hypothetical protein
MKFIRGTTLSVSTGFIIRNDEDKAQPRRCRKLTEHRTIKYIAGNNDQPYNPLAGVRSPKASGCEWKGKRMSGLLW